MINAILNPDRSRKTIVNVSEDRARSEGIIDIGPDDIWINNVPEVPQGMLKPILSEDGSEWIEGDPDGAAAIAAEQAASAARAKRNQMLKDSDWTQADDAPGDKLAWKNYRQELRDISSQPGFPDDIVWPTEPGA